MSRIKTKWALPIAISIFSLCVAGLSSYFSWREPQVDLEMPPFITAWQPMDDGSSESANFWVQPYFYYPGRSQRAEVITNMRLFVDPKGDAGPIEFFWVEQGGITTKEYTVQPRTNPSPVVIDPTTAASPLLRFQAIPGKWEDWQITPGRYKLTLRADRAVSGDPLKRQ